MQMANRLPIITPEEYTILDNIRIEHVKLMADMFEPELREIFSQIQNRYFKAS